MENGRVSKILNKLKLRELKINKIKGYQTMASQRGFNPPVILHEIRGGANGTGDDSVLPANHHSTIATHSSITSS
jgi:hypothetical protein